MNIKLIITILTFYILLFSIISYSMFKKNFNKHFNHTKLNKCYKDKDKKSFDMCMKYLKNQNNYNHFGNHFIIH